MRQHLATAGDASAPRQSTSATSSTVVLAGLTLGVVGTAAAPTLTAGFGLGALLWHAAHTRTSTVESASDTEEPTVSGDSEYTPETTPTHAAG